MMDPGVPKSGGRIRRSGVQPESRGKESFEDSDERRQKNGDLDEEPKDQQFCIMYLMW